MADHWNSLANKLGAPGVDLPIDEPETDATPSAEESVAPQAGGNADVAEANSGIENVASEPPAEIAETTGPAAEKPARSRRRRKPAKDADQSVRFQPAEEEESEGIEEAEASFEESTENEPEVIQALKPSAAEKPASSAKADGGEAKKKKRRSSWETLANMFNLKGNAGEEDEVEVEEATAEAVSEIGLDSQDEEAAELASDEVLDEMLSFKKKDTPSLSIFEGEGGESSNPALEEMFGEKSSSYEDKWDQNRPKVVDDVGWGDDDDEQKSSTGSIRDEDLSFRPKRKEKSTPDVVSKRDSEATDADSEEEREEAKRGGRRRRGRRGRGGRTNSQQDSVEAKEVSDDDSWGRETVESSSEQWDEPESFGDDEPSGEVERRSNRRRRRGRRSPEAPEARVSSPERDVEPAESDSDDSDIGWKTSRDEVEPEREARGRGRGRGGDSRRRSRDRDESDEKNEAPSRRRRRRPAREEEQDSYAESDESADDSEETPKHRNIPTWFDAIESLVENNIDNHKKNDRGGRGRSRGRR
ncbi:MAG: hypothetical protein ACE361_08160 [Aureliella sp.]